MKFDGKGLSWPGETVETGSETGRCLIGRDLSADKTTGASWLARLSVRHICPQSRAVEPEAVWGISIKTGI